MALNWGPWVGVAQLAAGRAEGVARFGGTPREFLSSLAPWIVFPLVAVFTGQVNEPAVFMAAVLVGQLTPPVVSHAVASRWGRDARWLRYATAYNWCQWAVSFFFLGALLVLVAVSGPDGPTPAGVELLMFAVLGFYLWIGWVVARHGLGIGRGRAALLVVAVNVATLMLLLIPQWIGSSPGGPAGG